MSSNKANAVRAIVVLPPGLAGRIRDRRLRRWLSKGRIKFVAPQGEMLHSVAKLIGHDARDDGLAALHFWGQTGERAGTWMAATDPVHLEARLDHLYLHDLRGEQMPRSDLQSILDYLQLTFGSGDIAFARLGNQGYLRGEQQIATASVSARQVHGLRPDDFMPDPGDGRSAKDYHRLLSEVQMALHEHEVNKNRIEAGLPEVNSLWIWGGGVAPEVSVQPIFPLFANDPLFKGFWLSRSGIVEPWSDGFQAGVAFAQNGFVSLVPESATGEAESPDRYLQQLKDLMAAGKISQLTLLFRDGLRADIGARDALRFWRGEAPLLKPPPAPQ